MTPGVESGGSITWDPTLQFLRVPAVPPTNLGGGKVINLDYFVEVTDKDVEKNTTSSVIYICISYSN